MAIVQELLETRVPDMADGGEDAIMKHMKALVPTHCADSGVTWAGFILTMRAASRVTIMCFDVADLDLVDDLCDDAVQLLELTTMLYPVLASAAAASASESAAEKVLVSTVTLTEDEKSVYPGIFSELAGGADTASVTAPRFGDEVLHSEEEIEDGSTLVETCLSPRHDCTSKSRKSPQTKKSSAPNLPSYAFLELTGPQPAAQS